MVNYKNSKIYKLVCNNTGLVYYGSTCQKLSDRKADHKRHYKSYLKGIKNFITSFDIVKGGNFDIVLVENVECENKEDLHARERWYIENHKCVNKYIPGRTKKEFREKHLEQIKEYMKEYYDNNKESIKQKNKEYYDDNKERLKQKSKEFREAHSDQIKEYMKEYKELNSEQLNEYLKEYRGKHAEQIKQKNKEYRGKHKEQIKQKNKEYREKHKEQIKQKEKENMTCECGSCVRKSDKARHFKSKKHLEYLKTLESNIV